MRRHFILLVLLFFPYRLAAATYDWFNTLVSLMDYKSWIPFNVAGPLPGDITNFDALGSAPNSPTLSAGETFNVAAMNFTPGAYAYIFTITGLNATLTFEASTPLTGGVNNSSGSTETFNFGSGTHFNLLNASGNAGTSPVIYNFTFSDATINSGSSSGNAQYNLNNATLNFASGSIGSADTTMIATASDINLDAAITLGHVEIDNNTVINNNVSLTIVENGSGTFSAGMAGGGALIKEGIGNLVVSEAVIIGPTAGITVNNGTFDLLSNISGTDITVNGPGILTGESVLDGALTVNDGGTFFLNNAAALFEVGTYTQNDGGIFKVTIDGAGNSGLLQVNGGLLTLGGSSSLLVTSEDGIYNTSLTYHIANNPNPASIVGTFANATAVNPLFKVNVDYTEFDIFINFTVSFLNAPFLTFNQKQVANQIDTLASNGTPIEQEIANALTLIPLSAYYLALDQMTGQQYATALLTAERGNEAFLDQLYNPLRSLINDPCGYCNCSSLGWIEASFGQASYDGNHDANGLDLNDYSVACGWQKGLGSGLTAGFGLSYVRDNISYRRIGGSDTNNAGIGALYALYRPRGFYVFGDLLAGYNAQRIKRQIDIGELHFNPSGSLNVFQSTLYAEGGVDCLWKELLIQPFIGIEGGYYYQGAVHEKTGTPLDLSFRHKSYSAAYTRLGLHLTTPETLCGIYFGVDGAWAYRLTSVTNHIFGNFNDFGTGFPIHGFNFVRNIFDGDLFISKECGYWNLFFEAGTQVANSAKNYNLTLGAERTF